MLMKVMRKTGRFFPRKRFAPDSEWSLVVEKLIQCIENSLVMNMHNVFQEMDSLLFFLLIIVVFLQLKVRQKQPFEIVKDCDRNDERYNSLFLVNELIFILISFMHVSKHLNDSRSHRSVNAIEYFLVGSDQKPTKPLQVVFHNVDISSNTFFLCLELVMLADETIDRVDEFALIRRLLKQLYTEIKKNKFHHIRNIFSA